MINWILAILGTAILQLSSIPQFIRNYKRKTTGDISIILISMVVIGYVFLLILSILEHNNKFIFIYAAGIINMGLLLIQILYYRKKDLK